MVFGDRPDRHQAVRALDGPAVGQRHDDPVADPLDRGRARAAHDGHAAALEHVLEHLGGVGVLPGQHAVAGGDQDDLGPEREVGRRRTRRRSRPDPTTISCSGRSAMS